MAEWLSRQNHAKIRDEEMVKMQLNIISTNATADIPACMNMQDIQQDTLNITHLHNLKTHVIEDYPSRRADIKQEILPY